MIIKISLKNKQITLSLIKDGKTVDSLSWQEDHELSKVILPKIDELLTEAKITPQEIEKVEVETDLPEGYTAKRILETVASVWNFAISKL